MLKRQRHFADSAYLVEDTFETELCQDGQTTGENFKTVSYGTLFE